ncbi:MAG TPA: hypothetical protein VNH46_02355 [Gemmatimonadales bacterium]|nr:hypothetical protein [Gemmatimonadales bacterium]
MRLPSPTPVLLLGVLALTPRTPLCGQDAADRRDANRYNDVGIAARVSTLGFGLEVNKWITGHLGARVGVNYFKLSATRTESDITYDASLKLHAVTALLDIFPSRRGAFHLTGGIISNPAKVSATGKPTAAGDFKINGNTYSSAAVGTLRGTAEFASVLPYLGLGWGTAARSGGPLAFLFDLGVAIGKPTITLTSTGAATNAALASDLKAQEDKTQHDVNKYAKVYPVIAFGLAYRF